MNSRTIMWLGILGVFIFLGMGFCSVVPWEIVGVLVAAVAVVTGFLLKLKSEEKERVELPTPTIEKTGTKPSLEVKKRGSVLLPDNTQITELSIDNSLLDQVYEQAYRQVIDIYDDAQLSFFTIQVLPFDWVPHVNIYFHFYSKWANRICNFRYSDIDSQLSHSAPDKRARLESDKQVLPDLPWKKSPHWMQFLSRSHDKIKPLPSVEGTMYHLSASPTDWTVTFEDGLSGEDYWFDWNGKGLDDNSIKQRSR